MLGPMQRQSCLGSGLPCLLLVPEALEVQEVQEVLVVLVEEVLAGDLEEPVAAAALAVDQEEPVVVVVAAGAAYLLSLLLLASLQLPVLVLSLQCT